MEFMNPRDVIEAAMLVESWHDLWEFFWYLPWYWEFILLAGTFGLLLAAWRFIAATMPYVD